MMHAHLGYYLRQDRAVRCIVLPKTAEAVARTSDRCHKPHRTPTTTTATVIQWAGDGPNIHRQVATLRMTEYSPTFVGGILQPIQPVTLDISHTQLSRPIP